MFQTGESCNLRVVDHSEINSSVNLDFKAIFTKTQNGYVIESQEDPHIYRLEVEKKIIRIFYEGENSYSMTFEQDKDHNSNIITPYGELPINVNTSKIEIHNDENNIYIFLNYNMSIEGEELERELEINCFR